MVMGENGIFNKANNAKEETEYSTALEEINLIILQAQAEAHLKGETPNLKHVIDELKKDERYEYVINKSKKISSISSSGEIKGIENLTDDIKVIYVMHKGYEFEIGEDIKIIEPENKVKKSTTKETVLTKKDGTKVTLTAQNAKDFYGSKIKYVNSDNNSVAGKIWRLFYIDSEGKYGEKGRIYLKADWTSNGAALSENVNNYTEKNHSTDAEVESNYKILKNMNPKWANNRIKSTWNTNEKAAAYLCDENNWTLYVSNNSSYNNYSIFAIGGASAEMYIDSYNSSANTSYEAVFSNPGYRFKSSATSSETYVLPDNSFSSTIGDGMYSGNWWTFLCSPTPDDLGALCLFGYSKTEKYNISAAGPDICPVISIKAGFPLEIID